MVVYMVFRCLAIVLMCYAVQRSFRLFTTVQPSKQTFTGGYNGLSVTLSLFYSILLQVSQ